ncbi:hypothetical protein PCAR4_570071 [Paraburkholderia caribensis]|nr:hypothetical protein PCAR4_570071 [Paraburkholderia caribensis]
MTAGTHEIREESPFYPTKFDCDMQFPQNTITLALKANKKAPGRTQCSFGGFVAKSLRKRLCLATGKM